MIDRPIRRACDGTEPNPRRDYGALLATALVSAALVLAACSGEEPDDGGAGGMSPSAGVGGGAGSSGAGAGGTTGGAGSGGAGGSTAGAGGAGSGGAAAGGTGGTLAAGAGAGGMGAAGAGGGGAGSGGAAGGGAGGVAGTAGNGGEGANAGAPLTLSETGLFTARGAAPGELVLAEGVREFEPAYWLWSDGADKKRYVYLPPGAKIDTSDPDHWVFPLGTKLWKSFISNGQLVETRLLERVGDEPNRFRYATYQWRMADSTDAELVNYEQQKMNASGTMHDIPNGYACERCHNGIKDRALGFSAIQLNHDGPGVTLQTLLDEERLTVPISTDIGVPGDDPLTKEALGYLHANCGNCHNDSPGLPIENVPEPQLLLRLSVNDTTFEDTNTFKTAVNQLATASDEIGMGLYRIKGGDAMASVLWYRMDQRGIEYQMPPIGTTMKDEADGLPLIVEWIESLTPP